MNHAPSQKLRPDGFVSVKCLCGGFQVSYLVYDDTDRKDAKKAYLNHLKEVS